MMALANVRRIILKHKRGAKCPLSKKVLTEWVKSNTESFISTCNIFEVYENEVYLWTDGDSVQGQTQFLMKKSAFNHVSLNAFITKYMSVFSDKTGIWNNLKRFSVNSNQRRFYVLVDGMYLQISRTDNLDMSA